jgi:branched-subunit amino acid transport protein
MNAFDVWVSIVLLTMATLLTRSSFFLFGHAVKLPPRLQHALGYAPAAAMAAIVMPDLVSNGGLVEFNWLSPKLLAGIGGGLFFLLTRHLLGTIIAGMTLFTVLRLTL